MQAIRRARLETAILEELSVVIPREVKDPRVPPLTLTSVQVNQDGSVATISISLLGSSTPNPNGPAVKDCIQGLTSASGFLRRYLAKTLTVRHIPQLIFREDRGYENVHRVHELLKEIEKKDPDSEK